MSMHYNRESDLIGVNHLKKVIEEMIEQVIAKNPELKLQLDPKQKETLVNNMLKVMEKGMGHEFERGKILDQDFSKRMTMCIMATLVLENKNHLQETMKNIFDAKKLDTSLILTMKPKEFKAFMEKNFTKDELKLIHKQLQDASEKLFKDLEKNFGAKPEPQASQKLADDMYTNLFGLMNSAIAGTHAVPISQFVGNGMGFNDWNPYDGNAPIDQVNSLKDTAFGDSLGLNAITREHYKAIDDTVVNQYYPDALYEAGQNLGPARPSNERH